MSKHAKKKQRDDKERLIREAERRRLEGTAAPTTSAEYEQLAMSSPNSSFVWIKYMAFLISLGEIDHARAVAERAIKTINFREENEKFNVWVAWLNAENAYGTEESTLALMHRAMTHTDARKMYLAAVDIFDRTEKAALVEQCLKAMCRKFSEAMDVWLRAIRYSLTQNDADTAKKTFDRSLKSLPRSEHVAMATQTALLEFKVGDPERGRSIFEGVLANYPRRLDLWSVYLDQEISKGGDQGRVRSLFERATHLALPPKKMKFLFKRYLEYEKMHGDDAGVEHVKKAAMEFVERAMATNNGGGGAE
jgi:rRNA biogenesis protein RRP5